MKQREKGFRLNLFLGIGLALLALSLGGLLLSRGAFADAQRHSATAEVLAAVEAGQSLIDLPAALPAIEEEEEDVLALTGLYPELAGMTQEEIAALFEDVPQALTAMGTIMIPSIELKLPILEGTSKLPLRYGAGWLTISARPGQPGNCTLLGHRMKADGALFNRLGTVVVDDKVVLTGLDGTAYDYTVREISAAVEPSALFDELYRHTDGKWLSLVTCTPTGVGSHRLVVWCELL